MTQDLEHQKHTAGASDVTTSSSECEPGRASRSALLRKADHTVPSGLLSRKQRDANGVADGAEHAVSTASSSSGSPLPETLQRKFEGSLGADLSGVRVHTGSDSAAANDAVGAKAYTTGNDIHFGAGQFDPTSKGGEHLLAHEVAHTVQQSGGASRMQFKLDVSSPGDAHEHEADRAADAMVSDQSASISFGSGVQRKVMRDAKATGTGLAPKDLDPVSQIIRLEGRIEATQSLLLGIQKRCNPTLDNVHTQLLLFVNAHKKAYDLYINKVNKELAESAEKVNAFKEDFEKQERLKKLCEAGVKVAVLIFDLALEEELGPLSKLVSITAEKIGDAAISAIPTPEAPTVTAVTVESGAKLFEKSIAGFDRLDTMRHGLINIGIAHGNVTDAHNKLEHIKDGLAKKAKTSGAPDAAFTAQLETIPSRCAKLDSAALGVEHRCIEALRQATMQATLADPQKLAEELESPAEKDAGKPDPYAAIGASAQVVTDIVPWGEVVVESKTKGKPTRFKARIFKADANAPAPIAHAGARRQVIGVEGDTLVLDDQKSVGSKETDVAIDADSKGNEKLIGKRVQVIQHLAPLGTVMDLETKKSYPAHANIQAGLPSGATRSVVGVEKSDVLVIEFVAGKDDKDGKGFAQYDGGPNDDLYFHSEAVAPGKPPEKYGYVYTTGSDSKGGTLFFIKAGYKLEGSGADLKAVKVPVDGT